MPHRFFRFTTVPLVAAAAVALSAPSLHAQPSCPFTYAKFEFIVPHVDIEECPDQSGKDGAFCRATTSSDQVHVFYFEGDGDQCLIKIDSFDDDAFSLGFKRE